MKGKSKKVKICYKPENPYLIGANPCLTEPDLKKQSQFLTGRFGVKSYLKGAYDNKPTCGA